MNIKEVSVKTSIRDVSGFILIHPLKITGQLRSYINPKSLETERRGRTYTHTNTHANTHEHTHYRLLQSYSYK